MFESEINLITVRLRWYQPSMLGAVKCVELHFPPLLQTLEILPQGLSLPLFSCEGSAASRAVYSQGLDGLQRSEEPFADSLQLVVIQREQIEVLEVLEGVHPQAVDLVGIEEAVDRKEASCHCQWSKGWLNLLGPLESGLSLIHVALSFCCSPEKERLLSVAS